MKGDRLLRTLRILITMAAVAAVAAPVFLSRTPWPSTARDYLERAGVADSGAINLVSAIYLGYRAFDTLGETIVLLVAVSGTISILSRSGASLAPGFGSVAADNASFSLPQDKPTTHTLRTHLIEVVTGKLGPVVLLFGFYLMLYGHLSPGGGFQGGVVIASGIVFIAIGSRRDASTWLTKASALNKIESLGFLLLMSAALSGVFAGKGVLGNPLDGPLFGKAAFIIVLNIVIGLKVGSGIGFMCIAMLGRHRS